MDCVNVDRVEKLMLLSPVIYMVDECEAMQSVHLIDSAHRFHFLLFDLQFGFPQEISPRDVLALAVQCM